MDSNVIQKDDKVLIFTHFECTKLRKLIKQYPNALVHVGDWPGNYWLSMMRSNTFIKALLGNIRFKLRSLFIPKATKLLFVSPEDTISALACGFVNSKTIEIGVVVPDNEKSVNINYNTLVFTGNFRYEPNRLAANQLIQYAGQNQRVHIVLVGYYANELIVGDNKNIDCISDVKSIPNYLNENRFIYVSPIKVGAGSKNKILEAIVSGCPVIATRESLDSTLDMIESIYIIDELSEVEEIVKAIKNNIIEIESITDSMKGLIIDTRSWKAISEKMRDLIYET